MSDFIGNMLRSVKEFFVEPVPDFGFDKYDDNTAAGDPLFDQAPIAPVALQNQPGHQEAVLRALARAAEVYFLGNVAPLLRNVPGLRWQIKQMQIRETAGNAHVLKEIGELSPSLLSTISKAVLNGLPCAGVIDLSQYYGLSIVPEAESVGRNVEAWACIGQEKIAMQVYFDDDIREIREDISPALPASGTTTTVSVKPDHDFHLRLTDVSGARDIAIERFPAVMGSSPLADIQANGRYVSNRHLVLDWDDVLQCVYLIDRSKHGTYVARGRRLADGQRFNLLGEGEFSLTNLPDAPRCEYWHGKAKGEGTALLPQAMRDAAPSTRAPSPNAEIPLKAFVLARSANRPARAEPDEPENLGQGEEKLFRFKDLGRETAKPTLLTAPDKAAPLAWLQVRNAKGHVDTVAIHSLPFSIGREIDGNGFSIDECFSKVSRTHLRLLELRGTGFYVNNESPRRPGQCNRTVGDKGVAAPQFVWSPQTPGSSKGWCVLGADRLDRESVEVRLVRPAHEGGPTQLH
ncbi:MAG TPA: FHA domain-containing protein [Burkholderiaceae bacterium]